MSTDRPPQETLEAIYQEMYWTRLLLKSIRKHLIVIAIPFWISLILLVAGALCWVLAILPAAGS